MGGNVLNSFKKNNDDSCGIDLASNGSRVAKHKMMTDIQRSAKVIGHWCEE